jgi:hypothetical protein
MEQAMLIFSGILHLVPQGADATFVRVIHDWDDDRAVTISERRKAILGGQVVAG